MLKMHERTVHAPPTHPPASIIQVKPEKVLRPQLQVKDRYVTEESFEYFVHNNIQVSTSDRLLVIKVKNGQIFRKISIDHYSAGT